MQNKRGKAFAVFFQIYILIGMTFALAYFINWNDLAISALSPPKDMKPTANRLISLSLKGVKMALGLLFSHKGFVSALAYNDLQQGAHTCPESKNGSYCQEYPASECASKCAVTCLPTTADVTSSCKKGTCVNPIEGTCSIGSPKGICESQGGQWFDDANGNIAQCQRGCCAIGNSADWVTARTCKRRAELSGMNSTFRPEIRDELSCIVSLQNQEEGACAIQQSDLKTCRFTTREQCTQITGKRDSFVPGFLCSASELGTNCQKQTRTACAQGKDGSSKVYWFDSCGNKENVYSDNKVASWNNGRVISPRELCTVQTGPGGNQETCGNCEFLLGSSCGPKTEGEKLADSVQQYVCRDISCVDEWGTKRENGESWCAYQGAIGLKSSDPVEMRSTDTIGSRHFRKVCINGEVRTDPCQDYRNEICVQSDTSLEDGRVLSSAACRVNTGYTCYEYNREGKTEGCEKNPDCFVKQIRVSDNFKFDVCAPKYKPGFDMETRGDGADALCKFGTQTCKYVKIKGLFSDTEVNKECLTDKFTKQMNDLCMSLGDCGAQANYLGVATADGYSVLRNDKVYSGQGLSTQYLNGLNTYADESRYKGQKADPGVEALRKLGLLPSNILDPTISTGAADSLGSIGMISGALGFTLLAAASTSIGASVLGTVGLAGVYTTYSGTTGAIISSGPGISAAGGVVAGAAIGAAVVAMLLKYTGVGAGLPPAMVYGLVAAGAAAGAVIGAQLTVSAGLASSSSFIGAMAAFAIIGVILIVAIIIFIIIMAILGIGKKKEIKVTFQCKPWQAPSGGANCNKCGTDGFNCSSYSCSSLGQTCQIINEERDGVGECISVARNDTNPPVITPITQYLPEGYSFEKFESGIKIKSPDEDGCIRETYTLIPFGIGLDEPGQCKLSPTHTDDYDSMPLEASGTSRYIKNHTIPLYVPSLESYGFESYDYNASFDMNFYLRCKDKSGNVNQREYNVQFCVKQGPDSTPPVIVGREPELEKVKKGINQLNASVYVNEPADCRWSTQDKEYSAMENQMVCEHSKYDSESPSIKRLQLSGFECSSVFPVSSNDSTIYVRCLDQPWLASELYGVENPMANESARAPSTTAYLFNIQPVTNNLEIGLVNVDEGFFSFAQEPSTIKVEFNTFGGLDGTARCKYQIGNASDEFHGSWTSSHSYSFQALFSGHYVIPIRCEDLIGNVAEKNVTFDLEVDATPPRASRVYAQSGSVVLITNEPSTCSYSTLAPSRSGGGCAVEFGNGTMMDGESYSHTAPIPADQTYYVKCKDSLGNFPGGCTAIIKKGGVFQ